MYVCYETKIKIIPCLLQQTNSNETIIIERILEANQQQKADVERALEVTLQKGDVEAVPPKIYNLNNSSENRPYKCEDCGKHFRKKTHVLAHMKFHNGEALPKCDVCGEYRRDGTCTHSHMPRLLSLF